MNIEALKRWRPPQLDKDKGNHWIQNSLIMIILIPFLGLWGAYVAGVILSIAVEVYQKITKTGEFDWYDALAGSLGCTSVLITGLLMPYFYAGILVLHFLGG